MLIKIDSIFNLSPYKSRGAIYDGMFDIHVPVNDVYLFEIKKVYKVVITQNEIYTEMLCFFSFPIPLSFVFLNFVLNGVVDANI